MKANQIEMIEVRRTRVQLLRDSYSLLRVAFSRIRRGDKPRFRILFK